MKFVTTISLLNFLSWLLFYIALMSWPIPIYGMAILVPLPSLVLLEGWRAAITVGTNDGPLTRLSNRY